MSDFFKPAPAWFHAANGDSFSNDEGGAMKALIISRNDDGTCTALVRSIYGELDIRYACPVFRIGAPDPQGSYVAEVAS